MTLNRVMTVILRHLTQSGGFCSQLYVTKARPRVSATKIWR